MCHVVDPTLALLYSNAAPLLFRHQMVFGYKFLHFFWQYNMPINKKEKYEHTEIMFRQRTGQ